MSQALYSQHLTSNKTTITMGSNQLEGTYLEKEGHYQPNDPSYQLMVATKELTLLKKKDKTIVVDNKGYILSTANTKLTMLQNWNSNKLLPFGLWCFPPSIHNDAKSKPLYYTAYRCLLCDQNKQLVVPYTLGFDKEYKEQHNTITTLASTQQVVNFGKPYSDFWTTESEGEHFIYYRLYATDHIDVIDSEKCASFGIIDEKGKTIVEPNQYCHLGEFNTGRAVIAKQINGQLKYGFINHKGEEIILCQYDDALNFKAGKAMVQINKEWFSIDVNGNRIVN